MKTTRKLLALLLVCALTLGLCVPVLAEGETTPTNIALGKAVTAKDRQGNDDGETNNPAANITDGVADSTHRWAADADMKENGVDGADPDPLEPKTVVIDLGEDCRATDVTSIVIKWYLKVWARDYTISTADTNTAETEWTQLYECHRPSQDNNSVTDTITYTNGTDEGTLSQNTLGRYVRFYFETVNSKAGGDGVSVQEIEIYGTLVDDGATTPAPAESSWNLAQGQPATSSANSDSTTPDGAVNGETDDIGWHSGNLKTATATDNSADDTAQTAQWLQIDLGASGTTLNRVKLYWNNNKVWGMEYKLQTTDTPTVESSWQDIFYVKRASSNGPLVQGAGQTIANPGEFSDTITTTSVPALTTTRAKRYIRLYILKVNAQAGGHNINLREMQVFGVNPSRFNIPIDSITASNFVIQDGQLTPANVPAGCTLTVRGSVLDNVIADNGAVGGFNIGQRNVTMLVRLAPTGDSEHFSDKNVTVTVPDNKANYPQAAAWFPTVTSPNPKPGVAPTLQEWYGYEGNFVLSPESRILYNDAADVGLAKAAGIIQESIRDITGLTLEKEAGTASTAQDIYLESLTTDVYDVGEEGYVLRIADDGVHIYAPTYTGCLFGAVSVEQMLWLSEDRLTVPCGITRDYPAFKVRGMKLDIARTPYRYQMLQDYAKIMMWYKMNEYGLHVNDNEGVETVGTEERAASILSNYSGFHRLESTTFPHLASSTEIKHGRVPEGESNAAYMRDNEDYGGNPIYTKQQWKDLSQLTSDYGMYLLTELDTPGHSLLYNKYAQAYPEELAGLEAGEGGVRSSYIPGGGNGLDGNALNNVQQGLELLALNANDPNTLRARQFIAALWNEYTSDGTITGKVVHIGADEYWDGSCKDNFAIFVDTMRQTIQDNLGADTKIRMWGAGTKAFSTATTALGKTHAELAQDYQLDIWDSGAENAELRISQGYEVVNCQDAYMYGNPGRTRRDLPNAEYLYDSWDPSIFSSHSPLKGEPNLLGAKSVIWGDESHEGIIEKDQHQRVLRAIQIVSEKTWLGAVVGEPREQDFSAFELRINALAEGPGTEIAMTVPSKTSLVLDYDFVNAADGTVYDTSGNGYDGTLTGGTVADGWLTFDGSTLVATPMKTLSYPYTVSFDVKLSAEEGAANTTESSLFSGYDGRIQAAGKDGKMTADVDYFVRNFDYTIPADGTSHHIDIVGTFQATRLYVDGVLVKFLHQNNDIQVNTPEDRGNTTAYASVVLPLQKIGQDFHGSMAHVKAYNKALSPAEIAAAYAGTDVTAVNVAQNVLVGGNSSRGNNFDNAVQRDAIAFKAVDGDTFTGDGADNATSELYSYWIGNQTNSFLTLDLGEAHTISQVGLDFRSDGTPASFKLQTSADGVTWTDVKTVSDNSTAHLTVNLDEPVITRYFRFQLSGSTCRLQEIKLFEAVDKTALRAAVVSAGAYLEEENITFGTQDEGEKAALDAYVLAKAVADSPIATQVEVDAALASLTEITLGNLVLTATDGAPLSGIPSDGSFKVTVPVTKPAQKEAVLVLASYKQGKLAQVFTCALGGTTAANQQFTLTGGADKLRAFLLTDTSTLKPHIEAKEYPAS